MTNVLKVGELSVAIKIAIYLALALLLVATRPFHFASALNLPDASLSVFFALGFVQSRHATFSYFLVLTVIIDLATSYFQGVFGDCITPSYPFLVIGYYLLWFTGKTSYFTLGKFCWKLLGDNYLFVACALWLSTSLAFLVSNSSYYWFSDKFYHLSLSQFVAQISIYYWPYILSTFLYVMFGLSLYLHYSFFYYHSIVYKEKRSHD